MLPVDEKRKLVHNSPMKVCVHKKGRLHPSTELLCEAFGIQHYHQYQSGGVLAKIPKAGDFLAGRGVAKNLKKYNTVFLEGLSCAPLLPSLHKYGITTIAKGNSHEIFFMERNPLWKAAFRSLQLDKNLGGMIAVSPMVKQDFRKYFRFPIEIAEGFLFRDYHRLSSLKQNQGQRNFLFIGKNPFLKGLDLMCNYFIRLKNEKIIPQENRFTIIGSESVQWLNRHYSGKQQQKYGFHGVPTTENLEPYLQNSYYLFHLARYEPNAVSVMEGMSSGLIPIVSTTTGNKDFISQINPELVIDLSDKQNAFANLVKVLGLPDREKTRMQKEFRRQSVIYSREEGLKRWLASWKKLTEEKKW